MKVPQSMHKENIFASACVDMYLKEDVYLCTLCQKFLRCIYFFSDIIKHRFYVFFFFLFLPTPLKVHSMVLVLNGWIKHIYFYNHFSQPGSLISEMSGSSFTRTKIPFHLQVNIHSWVNVSDTKISVCIILLLIMEQKGPVLLSQFAYNCLSST